MKEFYIQTSSPVGPIFISSNVQGLTSLQFGENKRGRIQELDENFQGTTEEEKKIVGFLQQAKQELYSYFENPRHTFQIPIVYNGTTFQRQVLEKLSRVPSGKTMSYLEMARICGRPKATRAIGGIMSRNRIAIILPCHRVIGHNGKLTGYAGGIEIKKWLLRHEGLLGI